MKRNHILFVCIFVFSFLAYNLQAQIYEPEGINMPGVWNAWENPPVNHLALASSTQVTNGEIHRRVTGLNAHYHTIIHCAESGGDVVGGNHDWLFTSGPADNIWVNKWAGVNVTLNTIQDFTYNDGLDNNITISNGNWYTINLEDFTGSYTDTRAIVMETSAEPVELLTVSEPTEVNPDTDIPITITSNNSLCPEEKVYICYTTDNWTSAQAVLASFTGASGIATIPGQSTNTSISYFAFSSTVSGITADFGLQSIDISDNDGANYSIEIGDPPPPTITWANLQWPENGEILPGAEFIVYGQALIVGLTNQAGATPDLQAWVGYSTSDTDPSTWTNWIAAPFQGDVGNNDEFSVNLGAEMTTEGTYYYATRFQYLDQDYVYGGFNGGFWNGIDNVNGELTVTSNPNPDEIEWCNLAGPADGEIMPLSEFLVYGQVYIDGITNAEEPVADLQAWIGWSNTDSDPSTWTNWIAADFSSNQGNNDEYSVDLGAEMSTEGTFYYATRFQYQDQEYVYGGYSEAGGGYWNGTDYINGELIVSTEPIPDEIDWCNLQWPPNGYIEPGNEFQVYGQVYIEGITDTQETPVTDLLAWIGVSETDSDPSAWTTWYPMDFSFNAGNNDEYILNLGAEMLTEGTFYYTTRFKYLDQEYVYGGFSDDNGGFWDGVNNVNGELTVSNDPMPDEISWCNLGYPGSGEIEPMAEFQVYGQVYIDGITNSEDPIDELQAWIGWSDTDTDPSTWTNWILASFNSNIGNNDEYVADLGAQMASEGTFYYATRFQYQDQEYEYGGYSESGGDIWDGVDYISGELTVTDNPTPDEIGWCNLQWPSDGLIEPGSEFDVYGQVFIDGVTDVQDNPVPDLMAWVGISEVDSDPAGWTIWYPMEFSANIGNDDEYILDLGAEMLTEGSFFYATRFQYQDQDYVYGGFSDEGGNFWDGTENVSGELTVIEDPIGDTIGWANLQWPPIGDILPNEEFIVYGQAYVENVTTQTDSLTDLQAWIGYNDTDTDPASWTNWIPAWYFQADGDNDEYSGDLGSIMDTYGTYYYATRFKYEDQDFVYGGYSEDGGGIWDGTENISGILTVSETPAPDTIGWCNLQWPSDGTIEPNAEFIVYAQAWIEGITIQEDSLTDLQAWIGFSTVNSDPSTWTNWVSAWYSYGVDENDEYETDLGAIMGEEGVFYYASRFQYQDQEYVYGGYSDGGGDFWDGINNVNGMLNVQSGPVTYPVEFMVTDATGLYSNIKFKGDMTGWNPVDMQQEGDEWSVSLEIAPGTYEWGVFEDDGSTNGIWLIIGDNLVLTVDDLGNISGDTTYIITFVGLDELSSHLDIYPNPVNDQLWINSNAEGNLNIRLLDASGKLVRTIESVDQKTLIDMQQLNTGLYFLEISDKNHQFRTKIIKQ